MRDLKNPEQRHPEKARRPDNPQPKKPDWIRVKAPDSRSSRCRGCELLRPRAICSVSREGSWEEMQRVGQLGLATQPKSLFTEAARRTLPGLDGCKSRLSYPTPALRSTEYTCVLAVALQKEAYRTTLERHQ